jgi:hypothetical protein
MVLTVLELAGVFFRRAPEHGGFDPKSRRDRVVLTV